MKKSYAMGTRHRNWGKIWLALFIVIALSLVTAAFLVRRSYNEHLRPFSASQKTVLVTIPSGATAQQIGKQLQDKGLIKASWAFEWYVRNNNTRDRLQAGTYALRPSQSVKEITAILTQGKVDTSLVTILPGRRLEDVRDSLINQGFNADEVDAALNPKLYSNHPALVDKPEEANLEGYLYPESFQKTADTEVTTIIKLALDELQKQLTPDVRAGIVNQGLTVHEAIILASVVGQEVSIPKEQKVVAQIFLKRLREDIELGADATTRYAVNKPKGPLTAEELSSNSLYNTRKSKGLPPGPISNFKASALQAVAFPESGDYLFFVTGRDFVTRFSRTISEHEALIKQHGASGEE